MWYSIYQWLKVLRGLGRRNNLARIGLVLLLVILGGTIGLSYFEALPAGNALWWSIVTITTVGYGDITPVTTGGRIIGVATMVAGIGMLGALTATLASMMVNANLEGLRGMRPVTCMNHLVICGWSHKVHDILTEFRQDYGVTSTPVVLIADVAEVPFTASQFFFVRGEVTPDTMVQANMAAARAALVLGDQHTDAFACDARTILTTLTIKTAYPQLYTCVELTDARHRVHCQRARADEIIVGGALTNNLLVRAVLDPGVTRLVSDLLSPEGHELYLPPIPAAVVGTTFLEALAHLKSHYDALLVAITGDNGQILTNPDRNYRLQPSDRLYLIAEHRPQFAQ